MNARKIGKAMSDANQAHILQHQRELTLEELGEVAFNASGVSDLREALEVANGWWMEGAPLEVQQRVDLALVKARGEA